jgi:hypothetical protein
MLFYPLHALLLLSLIIIPAPVTAQSNITLWNLIWVGGQSNSVGTNSQKPGQYPTWPTTPRIQSFCWRGACNGTFTPAQVPLFNEDNVGFSNTFANLLLQSLPEDQGIVLINTGVGGTGFHDGNWVSPTGRLLLQSLAAFKVLVASLPTLAGAAPYKVHSLLWHQGECDAGDNRGFGLGPPPPMAVGVGGATRTPPTTQQIFQADYCQYLAEDLSPLIDFVRGNFPGAAPTTPFIDGGLLPYWVDKVNGTGGVMDAIYALNTSRACTGTADSRVFPDYKPDGVTPNGDPAYRSGASGLVIHFDATQAFFLGFQYYQAFLRAMALTQPVPSPRTSACPGSIQPSVTQCG